MSYQALPQIQTVATGTPLASSRRKVLMLHGYGQNAYIMSRYTKEFTKKNPDVEFVYLDGPMQLVPVDFDSSDATTMTTVDPTECYSPSTSPARSETARGWFKIKNFSRYTIEGLDTTLRLLKKVLAEDRFEAIMGFSQGAALAELFASMLEHPEEYAEIRNENGDAVHPPLKYIVTCSGFILRGPYARWDGERPMWPTTPLSTPVLHLIGYMDTIITRDLSELLMTHHRNIRVEEHVGGHFVPQHPRWTNFFASFFKSPFGDIPSPTAGWIQPSSTYKTGETLVSALSNRSGASTPDSLGPTTPVEEMSQEDLFKPTAKSIANVEEMQLASMWAVYDGLVYRGN